MPIRVQTTAFHRTVKRYENLVDGMIIEGTMVALNPKRCIGLESGNRKH